VGAALGAAGLPYLALQAVMGTTVFICCCSQILLGLTTSSCTWARINAHQSINQSIIQAINQSINHSSNQSINQSIKQSLYIACPEDSSWESTDNNRENNID